jgi:hypothetical protein
MPAKLADPRRHLVRRPAPYPKRELIPERNMFDPDGTRVELMEDHTVDGLISPMTTLPMFSK